MPARASGSCSTQKTGAVLRSTANCSCGMASQLRSGSVKSKPSGRMSVVTQCSLGRCSAVGDPEVLDAVDPAVPQPARLPELADVRRVVGERLEDQVDLEAGQVGADAVVRAVATEGLVRVVLAGDIEAERVLEHVLVEVRTGVVETDAVALGDRHAADLEVV